jgi:hypothetical protein
VPALEWSLPYEALARAAHDVAPPPGNQLLTRLDGPAAGPLAFGLACGALLAVQAAAPWNDVGPVYGDYIGRMRSLRDTWGVTNAAQWRERMDTLLSGDGGDPRVSLVLTLRRRSALGTDPAPWQRAIERWSRDNDVPPEALLDLAARIGRYETRLRDDGLLPAGRVVGSTFAYDFGRAVNMARWGREAHFCDQDTAERLIVDAGRRCRRHYDSWAALSAGYVLGRVLRFEDGDSGTWYDSVLAAHRLLTDATGGPWQTLAW